MCPRQERKESKKNKKMMILFLEAVLIHLIQIKIKELDILFKQ